MIEAKPKPKNLARRVRLNPDWPITVFVFDCWPQGAIPQSLWDTARMMQQLWNELCAVFDAASAADVKGEDGKPALSKDERKAIYAGLDLKPLREIAKRYGGLIPAECYYSVVDRFLVTFKEWRKAPKHKGPPRQKFALDKINIPLVFNAGQSTDWLAVDTGHVFARNVAHLKPAPGEEPSPEYLRNGRFNVGINREPLHLHVALHRALPEVGRIKRVSLVGKREEAFGWSWQLQAQVEHSAVPSLPPVGRVAGLDLGWRVREDGLRIGVLADSSGHRYELRLPFAFGNRNARRRSEWLKSLNPNIDDHTIADWRDLWEWQRRADAWKDLCKQKLSTIPDDVRALWPNEARRSYAALQKMGVGGLRRLNRLLTETGIDDAATATLAEWKERAEQYTRWIRGQQLNALAHRQDHYRKLADWLARNFDVIAWEGDLGLKEMAEEDSGQHAIENAKTYRHLASLHLLRTYIAQALKKHGRTIQPVKTAWTNRCAWCGAYLEPSSNLLAVCENGHTNDVDEAASAFLCSQIETPAGMCEKAAEIPTQLNRYLRRLDAKP